MRFFVIVVSVAFYCCLAAGRSPKKPKQPTVRRDVVTSLFLSNGLPWGQWGPQEYCPEGSFAIDMEVKFEPYKFIDADETALNSVKLFCETQDMQLAGYVTSSEGSKGEWQGMRLCTSGWLTGLRAKVLPSQGVLGDDVAVQNIQMICANNTDEILTGVDDDRSTRIPDGDYGNWVYCPEGSAICGVEVRLEDATLVIDDTAVGDIIMFCCSLQ